MLFCQNCGKQNDNSSNFCIYCGSKLIMESIKCSNCGQINESDSNFCMNCGNNLKLLKKEINISTRQEAEKKAEELKKRINKKPLIKMSIGGKDIGSELDKSMKKELNQKIDDCIIEKYGTDEEKEKMKLRKEHDKIQKDNTIRIHNKYDKGRNSSRKLEHEKAITLFKEVINEAKNDSYIFPLVYYELSECYYNLGDYDNAVEILEKGLETMHEDDDLHSFFKKQIETYKSIENKEQLRDLRTKALNLYHNGDYEDAIPIYQKCVDLYDEEYYTYIIFAEIYHKKREFELECKVLEKGIKNINFEPQIHNDSKTGLGDKLENVNYYLENGKFKWDCLPVDDNSVAQKIRHAKAILKENEQRGIELLEDILEEGTFNNTVYYTLYKTYLKNGKYNSAISISDEAIDNLGLYSQDRLEKWSKYKDKAIKQKEKKQNN